MVRRGAALLAVEVAAAVAVTASAACGGRPDPPPPIPPAVAAAESPDIEIGWEKDCGPATCGTPSKEYVACSDPNGSTHYHFGGRKCVCENHRSCGECSPNDLCPCALDVVRREVTPPLTAHP